MNAPESLSPPQAPAEVRRLLVVDDEEIVLVALRETLVRAGYEVVGTGDAHEAVELLRQQTFAVIITDQQMPRLTGLEFLARAKEIQPDATRILITAVLNLSTVIEAINKGEIYRFIIKPWLREEFLGAVESAVQRFALVSGNSRLQASTAAMEQRLEGLNRQLEEQRTVVAGLHSQIEDMRQGERERRHRSVELCVRLMEVFYPTLATQARRVFELCRSIGAAADLSTEELDDLCVAAWLHDIGFLAVPRRLIRKWELTPESLDESERSILAEHPLISEELVGFVEVNEAVQSAVRTHHEHFDGTGYPHRIGGDSIPWLGRLLAVAVAYADANHEHGALVELIRDRSGTAFDPEAVLLFMRSHAKASVPRKQREVSLTELRPGMVLAKGIYTANGVLLVPGGHELSETYIDKLRNHHRISPIAQSLMVYC